MKKEQYFNFIYNDDEKLGFGKGYYLFFQDHNGEDIFSKYYPIQKVIKGEHTIETIHIGVLDDFYKDTDLGWKYNPYYRVDLTEQFKRKEDI